MSTPITAFNKQNLPEVRAAVTEALSKVAAQFGLESIEIANISFDREGTHFRTQLEAKVKASLSPALQKKQTELSRLLGYDANIIGEEFTTPNGTYKVTDINLNRPKYPINADDVKTGKSFKFGAKNPLPLKSRAINWDKEQASIFQQY